MNENRCYECLFLSLELEIHVSFVIDLYSLSKSWKILGSTLAMVET
jgi:hypothetical protein